MIKQTECSVSGCSRKYHAKNWCLMHYKRNLKYGSPHITKKDCSMRFHKKNSTEKFLLYFNDSKNPLSCWIWRGPLTSRGYGTFGWKENGKIITRLAHRFAWEYYNKQQIPPGMLVCHHCDNPPCVNPEHLFLGTPQDNIQDAINKGRLRKATRANPHYH